MNRFVLTALASLSLVASASAAETIDSPLTFFQSPPLTGGWVVYGKTAYGNAPPHCSTERTYKDGSRIAIFFDLDDGEVYAGFQNIAWQIGDVVNAFYEMRLNFHYADGKVQGRERPYELLNKNTIRLRHLDGEGFMQSFIDAKELRLIFPGTIENVTIPLNGTRDTRPKMLACVELALKTNLHPVKKDQSRLTPKPKKEIIY